MAFWIETLVNGWELAQMVTLSAVITGYGTT